MTKNPLDQEVETLLVPVTQLKVAQTKDVEAQDCLDVSNKSKWGKNDSSHQQAPHVSLGSYRI